MQTSTHFSFSLFMLIPVEYRKNTFTTFVRNNKINVLDGKTQTSKKKKNEDIIINRLRTGHFRLTYGFLMANE